MSRAKKHVVPIEIEADNALSSIISRETVIERLREEHTELQVIPNYQRVTISGEETSGVQYYIH